MYNIDLQFLDLLMHKLNPPLLTEYKTYFDGGKKNDMSLGKPIIINLLGSPAKYLKVFPSKGGKQCNKCTVKTN